MIECLLTLLLVHPIHETLAEVEWNPNTGRVEVSLLLDGLDEEWIARHHGRESNQDDWRLQYLRDRFRFSLQPPAAARTDREVDTEVGADALDNREARQRPPASTYHWVGRKQEGSHVWWFFEVVIGDRQQPRWITQQTLFERDERYVNRVVILGSKPRRTLAMTRSRSTAELPNTP